MSNDTPIVDADDLPLLMNVKEAAALLRCNPWTVYDLVKRGELPGGRKLGGSIRIHRDELLDYIRTGRGE